MSSAGKRTIAEARARILLRATVSPSEDPARVKEALEQVTGGVASAAGDSKSADLVTDDPRALSHVRDQLRDRHVRSAARKKLLASIEARSAFLILNRQAASAGVIALCDSPDESPLGPIFFEMESDSLAEAIDWLTAYAGG